MYSSSLGIVGLIVWLLGAVVTLVILYLIIRSAVTEGMKNHTRWQVANRDEIEAKYGKKRPDAPDAPGAPSS